MSEKSKPNKNKYIYKYIQFTATSHEKKEIKHFANKENFKTTSEYVRRIVFDYVRIIVPYTPSSNSINTFKI